jgi:WD40 repeat protein
MRRVLAVMLVLLFALRIAPVAHAQELELEPVRVFMAKYSPDGARLAIGYGATNVAGGLMVWNLAERRVEKNLPFKPGVSSLAISPDGKLLVYTQVNLAPQVVKFPSLEPEFATPETRRGPVDFSPDGKLLAMNAADFGVYVREMATGRDLPPLIGHKERVPTLAFAPDSKTIAAPGDGGTRVWDVATGKVKFTLRHRQDYVSSVAFSPDSRWIFTGAYNSTVRIWNAESGALRATFELTGGGIRRLAYSAATNQILAAAGGTISICEVDLHPPATAIQEQIQRQIGLLGDDSYPVRQAASQVLLKLGFVAEAALATAAKDSPSAEVRVGARHTRQEMLAQQKALLIGHTGEIRSLALSPDGKWLVSASDDGTVRIWDLTNRRELESFSPARVSRSP